MQDGESDNTPKPADFALILTGAPGWAELELRNSRARYVIQFAELGGRWAVTTLIVNGEALDSNILKAIPLARIESYLNHPEINGLTVHQELLVLPHIRTFPAQFKQIEDALRSYFEQTGPPSVLGSPEPPEREALTRPDGSDPDAFYRKVAAAYSAVVVNTSRPAKVLAEEAGVPVATVHRWISEARRRGFLPPARKGRAGR